MKVAELLEIVASQECVFEKANLMAISEDTIFGGAMLSADGKRLGVVTPPPYESNLKLKDLASRLRPLNPQAEIEIMAPKGVKIKIGFLDYHEGWVETVTSDELGLSEDPK